jgi:sugar/nucleoside kinase (ribokinase family)
MPKTPQRKTKTTDVKRNGIVAAGTFVIDRIATVKNYPADDTYAAVLSETITNGGPAFNALVDWAHMKVAFPLYALGLVGKDADGQWVRGQLDQLGVETSLLGVHSKARTSVSTIVSATSSRTRTIFHHAGANAELDATHFPFPKIKAKIFFLAFLALLDRLDRRIPKYGTVAAKLFAQAKAHGMITAADVVSDTSGRLPDLVAASLPYLDHFFCNEVELGLVTGQQVRDKTGKLSATRMLKAASDLAAKAAGYVVVHTAEGAAAARHGETAVWQPSLNVPREDVVGTNGAGDAFAAGYLSAVHDEFPIQRCLERGVVVAAASLLSATPSQSVGNLRSCAALAKRWGFRARIDLP